ncbi:Fe2+-enterobactin ABC transporter substrate-binding protein [uncultured Corynebacterium sp.]|uniref:Fe2+-enterobactin ABC transporter substrate-binding protein n=1 Tax=uncultured Corynebacterium sp. TaxID=159447 RepID=UPI0025D0EBB2|nr:Fe2+-enterobactin ABC transporter substrate-binding protein [uncultured Corynebacterium sp.]
MTFRKPLRWSTALVATAALAFASACSSDSESTSSDSSATSASSDTAAEAQWPRTVSTLDGEGNSTEVELEEEPQNIVSTSVTLTGHLLALDAPVTATGVQSKGNGIANDKGFFTQWADEAEEANVEVAYEGEPNVEAILAQDPDLVIMSASGQDSATAVYDQLADVVPVVVIDYSNQDWTEVLGELGEATGHEEEAETAVDTYTKRVEEVKNSITQPEQPVNIVSLGQGGSTLNVWTEESAQGRLFSALGWEIAVPDDQYGGGDPNFDGRSDVVSVAAENYAPALTGKTILAINPDGKTSPSDVLKSTEQLANNEAITNDRVYDFNPYVFRIDYFSALQTLDDIEETFA